MITRKQLIDYLVKEKGSLPAASPIIAMGQFPLVTIYDVIVDVKDYGTGEQEEIMLSDVLAGIGPGGGGAAVGIDRIQHKETSDDGLIDTYTIVLTNGTQYDFNVRNGKDYVMTEDDKTEIINGLLGRLPVAEEVSV